MAIFQFPQFEHELFWRYFKRLSAFLTRCGYCLTKWEILDIITEGVNSETGTPLGYWDFHGKSLKDACYLLEWIAWDSFEFEKASLICRYSISIHCTFYYRSYYAPFWCNLCSYSDHATNSCPHYVCYTQPYFASPTTKTQPIPEGKSDANCGRRKMSEAPTGKLAGPDGIQNFQRNFQRTGFPSDSIGNSVGFRQCFLWISRQ